MYLSHRELPNIVQWLKDRLAGPPEIGVVLGSGLGALADEVEPELNLEYKEIPGFFKMRIPGHRGRLIVGMLAGRRVALFAGRVHLYEGYSFADITLTTQIMFGLGAHAIALSSSVGGLNPAQKVGDFLLIEDHINLQGGNPILELVSKSGRNPFKDPQSPFVDMCAAYRTDFYDALCETAKKFDRTLHKGVLAALTGPTYETPAEVRMLQRLGADAVCMSTVPEAIMARYLGLQVAGICQITNTAYAQKEKGPTHEEVLDVSQKNAAAFMALMKKMVELL